MLEALKVRIRAFRPGRPHDWDTTMGAIISQAQFVRVLSYIESGRREGASLVCGGNVPPGLPGGYFIEPTVFAGVTPQMRIAREEIFGPVLSVLRFSSEAEAVALANASPYGLQASVWSDNVNRAHRVARALRAGTARLWSAPTVGEQVIVLSPSGEL